MSTRLKRQLYAVSFVMALVQIGCLLVIVRGAVSSGAVSFRHLAPFWIASASVGLICAVLSGGDLTRQRSASPALLGFVLNGGLLAILGVLYVVSFVHD